MNSHEEVTFLKNVILSQLTHRLTLPKGVYSFRYFLSPMCIPNLVMHILIMPNSFVICSCTYIHFAWELQLDTQCAYQVYMHQQIWYTHWGQEVPFNSVSLWTCMSFQTMSCHNAFLCRYKFIMSKNKVKFSCVGSWVISFAINTLIYTVFNYDARAQTRCLVETYVQPKYGAVYVAAIFLPLATTVALYGKIVFMLKRRSIDMASMSYNSQISQSSDEASKNVMKLAFFVSGEKDQIKIPNWLDF